MEAYLHTLLSSSTSPYLTAFVLGILINISPCPLCTNITAIGYLSKDLGNRKKVLQNSLLYMLGKTLAYVVLGVVLYYTANFLSIRAFFEEHGEQFLGPILILAGILLLDVIKFHKHDEHCNHKHFSPNKAFDMLGALGLGLTFALAFCPYSGFIYFGMLMPMSIEYQNLLLVVVFSVATVLPVFIIAWLLAYGVSSIANMQNKLNTVDFWVRKITALLFILIGLYVCYETFFCHHHG